MLNGNTNRMGTTALSFQNSRRVDAGALMSSGRAGLANLHGYIPLLRGDSLSGSVSIDVELAEMPRPLLNGVTASISVWFVPKSAHPKFNGMDEFRASYQGEQITAVGQAPRDPAAFFDTAGADLRNEMKYGPLFRNAGIHFSTVGGWNTDLVDAYQIVHNFRQAAYSSKLPFRKYAVEMTDPATEFAPAPAFWPPGQFSAVVPDYERALVVGELDLDMSAGAVPVLTRGAPDQADNTVASNNDQVYLNSVTESNQLIAEVMGTTLTTSLSDIDSARKAQAFAKYRSRLAGNETTGFSDADTMVAEMMQGFSVPAEEFNRPWLLASSRVPFGFSQRYSTDSTALDVSVSQAVAQAQLSITVPKNDVGGCVIVLVEVLPDRVYERALDPTFSYLSVSDLPDALRDVQRVEPVDIVTNGRLDAVHTDPTGLYGYEPMNNVWNRQFTRLGGDYFNPTPGGPWTEARSAIWAAEVIDPTYTQDQFLAPLDFPHDVFSDPTASAYTVVARHSATIVGLTQIGDVVVENNDDYDAVTGETA